MVIYMVTHLPPTLIPPTPAHHHHIATDSSFVAPEELVCVLPQHRLTELVFLYTVLTQKVFCRDGHQLDQLFTLI